MQALSPNARRAYEAHWTKFKTFLQKKLRIPGIPATPHHIAMYVSHLHYHRLKVSTIRTHLSAIAFMHEATGYKNPTKSFTTQKLLTAYSRTDPAPKTRKPITRNILKIVVKSAKKYITSHYNRYLFTSIFTVMYHAALRASEICESPKTSHTLQTHNINLSKSNRSLKVQFSSYKHSTSLNPPLVLYPTKYPCPVKSFIKYKKLRKTHHGPAFCYSNGTSITRDQLQTTLHKLLTLSGYNSKLYNTHSFRIGKTTDLAKHGYSYSQIAQIGRWKSTAYLRYIKPTKIHTT